MGPSASIYCCYCSTIAPAGPSSLIKFGISEITEEGNLRLFSKCCPLLVHGQMCSQLQIKAYLYLGLVNISAIVVVVGPVNPKQALTSQIATTTTLLLEWRKNLFTKSNSHPSPIKKPPQHPHLYFSLS